jgi:DUF1009 family protein
MAVSPLGIVAGGGDLPVKLAAHASMSGRKVFVLALQGFADPALLARHPGAEAALGEIGKAIRLLDEAGCREIVFAGAVQKPNFSTSSANLAALKFDLHGASLFPQLAVAAGKGDDALLRVVLGAFEKAGFSVIGADDVLADLLAPSGAMGNVEPSDADWLDVRAAAAAALELGARDEGQGAVARDGAVIAREAADGTDAMLSRVAVVEPRRGVLVKRPKPQQERRIDLPTIGMTTVQRAADAGLAGIAVAAGGALVLDAADAVRRANELGLFVYGFTEGELA